MGRCMIPEGQWKKTTSHGRPPRFTKGKMDIHQVPTWEKTFCHNNGVSWQKVLTAKRFVDQHERIMRWDDSASKEAFENAKARYWANIRGLQPLPLPDYDAYIEEVDNDAPPSDPMLYKNLHGSISDEEYDGEEEEVPDWGEGGVILLDEHYCKEVPWFELGEDHQIIATGWVA